MITKEFTQALRDMQVGDVITLSVKAYSSMRTIIPRLRIEMCVEQADWEVGEIDRKAGMFSVKRIA